MSNWDVFIMCLRNMFKRKLRTILTVLGVMVGTAAIVLMISLGLATEAHHRQQMEEAEQDMALINVWAPWENAIWNPDGSIEFPEGTPLLNDEMIDSFERIPGVLLASQQIRGSLYVRSDPYFMEVWNVIGIRAKAMQFMGLQVAEGRTLMPGDEFAIVFGALAERGFERMGAAWDEREERLWQPDFVEVPTRVDVMNDPIRISYDQRFVQATRDEQMDLAMGVRPIRSYDVEVVGLLAPSNNWSTDRGIFIDADVLMYLETERMRAEREVQSEWQWLFTNIEQRPRETYDEVMVRVDDVTQTARVAREIEEMGFQVSYAGMLLNLLMEGQRQQQAMLAAIGAVSLIVAAIGIANTMIMAVYERTREIGIMKVIGAAIRDIRRLFLLESAMIGLFGGLFGVGLSLLGSYILNNYDVPFMQGPQLPDYWMGGGMTTDATQVSLVTPWLCGVAMLFATTIGLVSGYFPATRATKLSALAAIRSE